MVRRAIRRGWWLDLAGEMESAPEVSVPTAQTTGARTEFSRLTPGKVYVIALNAVGAAGVSDWSDYGSLMVI